MINAKTERLKGILIGMAVMLFITIGVTSVGAVSNLVSIKVVKGGITLYVDGKLVKPQDGNGKVIDPILYEGTTYLPLRALSNALTNGEKEVKWDSKTSTIFVGEAPMAKQIDITELQADTSEKFVNNTVGDSYSFPIIDKTYTPFNYFLGLSKSTYILNSKYSTLHGRYIAPVYNVSDLSDTETYKVNFYNITKSGEEVLIDSYEITNVENDIPITVDLRGVEYLKIDTGFKGLLYNVTLESIENSFSK